MINIPNITKKNDPLGLYSSTIFCCSTNFQALNSKKKDKIGEKMKISKTKAN